MCCNHTGKYIKIEYYTENQLFDFEECKCYVNHKPSLDVLYHLSLLVRLVLEVVGCNAGCKHGQSSCSSRVSLEKEICHSLRSSSCSGAPPSLLSLSLSPLGSAPCHRRSPMALPAWLRLRVPGGVSRTGCAQCGASPAHPEPPAPVLDPTLDNTVNSKTRHLFGFFFQFIFL